MLFTCLYLRMSMYKNKIFLTVGFMGLIDKGSDRSIWDAGCCKTFKKRSNASSIICDYRKNRKIQFKVFWQENISRTTEVDGYMHAFQQHPLPRTRVHKAAFVLVQWHTDRLIFYRNLDNVKVGKTLELMKISFKGKFTCDPMRLIVIKIFRIPLLCQRINYSVIWDNFRTDDCLVMHDSRNDWYLLYTSLNIYNVRNWLVPMQV